MARALVCTGVCFFLKSVRSPATLISFQSIGPSVVAICTLQQLVCSVIFISTVLYLLIHVSAGPTPCSSNAFQTIGSLPNSHTLISRLQQLLWCLPAVLYYSKLQHVQGFEVKCTQVRHAHISVCQLRNCSESL